MEVAWSKVGAIWRMLEDFPLEILQRPICLVDSMGTHVVMREQQSELLKHPAYSPDLAPSDFHLIGPLKHHLSAEHFPDDEAVEREVTAWFQQQPKEFYAADFQRLVKRWDMCLNIQGDYVEK
jgi:histone-lysine N-methyltransferase SETMAR